VTFDRANPALKTAIAITGLQSGETVAGIDIRAGGTTPGTLYAIGSGGHVYSIDTTTGVATTISTLSADPADTSDPFTALSGTHFGVDFDPVFDRLRVVSDTGQNLSINVDTGATITDAALTVAGSARSGVNGAAYSNAFSAACRASLYYLDSSTDELLTTDAAGGGVLRSVGPLGVDADAVGDFEIATAADGTNNGYAVLVVGGVPTSYQIDLATGTAATAGPVTLLDAGEVVQDTAIAPPATAPTQQAGDVFAITESNKLLSFNSAAPQKMCTSADFTGQQSGEKIVGIDVRPADQMLYALGSTGRLYTVDTASAALTLKSTLVAAIGDATAPYAGLTGTQFGFDFNPGNDVVRVVTDTGQSFRAAPDNGVVTTDTDLNPAGAVVSEAAYSNNFAAVGTASFYVIDTTTDSLQVVGRSTGNAINGDVSTVGALGVSDVQGVGGFDIFGTTNFGLAALNLAGGTSSDLYSVNLLTGAATRLATLGGGERVSGLAYARTPVATVFGLTSDSHLVSFKPLTPGTIDSDVAITGLASGESVVGIDIRPADGALYAVSSQGRVYTLDEATGALANGVSLVANPLDASTPYAGLSGNRFGVDFGSADGVLRIQSDTGQNLRVNLADNTVITDGTPSLGGVMPKIVSTAMTNPYAGATTSQQYSIDVNSNSLLRQTSISGAQSMVGALTVGGTPATFQDQGGFDIAGAENGLPVAALLPSGATQSMLYRVNLANGALTSLGAIGSGTTVISDIAVRVQ
jgi:hypothetical protein